MFAILVPYYNEEKYIGRLINSLKQQVDKNFVVVFVDNLSTDRTREIIQSHSDYINKTWFVVDSKHKGKIHTFKPGSQFVKFKFPKIKYLATIDADTEFENDNWTKSVNDVIASGQKYSYLFGPRRYIGFTDYPTFQKAENIHNEVLNSLLENVSWTGYGHNLIYNIDDFIRSIRNVYVNGDFILNDLRVSLNTLLFGSYPTFVNCPVKTSGRRVIDSKATFDGYCFYDRGTYLTYIYNRAHLCPDLANVDAKDFKSPKEVNKFLKHRSIKLAEQHFAPLIVFERSDKILNSLNSYLNLNIVEKELSNYKFRPDLERILWEYTSYAGFIDQLSDEPFVKKIGDAILDKFMEHCNSTV